jgi:hypothetical protein
MRDPVHHDWDWDKLETCTRMAELEERLRGNPPVYGVKVRGSKLVELDLAGCNPQVHPSWRNPPTNST